MLNFRVKVYHRVCDLVIHTLNMQFLPTRTERVLEEYSHIVRLNANLSAIIFFFLNESYTATYQRLGQLNDHRKELMDFKLDFS